MRLQLSNKHLLAILIVMVFGLGSLLYYEHAWRVNVKLPFEPKVITQKRQVNQAVKRLFEDAQVKEVKLIDDGGSRWKAAAFVEVPSGDSTKHTSIYYLFDRNGQVIDFN